MTRPLCIFNIWWLISLSIISILIIIKNCFLCLFFALLLFKTCAQNFVMILSTEIQCIARLERAGEAAGFHYTQTESQLWAKINWLIGNQVWFLLDWNENLHRGTPQLEVMDCVLVLQVFQRLVSYHSPGNLVFPTWAVGDRRLAPVWAASTARRAATLQGREPTVRLRFRHPAFWKRKRERWFKASHVHFCPYISIHIDTGPYSETLAILECNITANHLSAIYPDGCGLILPGWLHPHLYVTRFLHIYQISTYLNPWVVFRVMG